MNSDDADTITRGNDRDVVYQLTRRNADTGAIEPATGLSGVTAHLSITDSGDATSGATVTLVERSARPGEYYGVLDAAQVDSATEGRAVVFEVLVRSGDVRTSRRLRVIAVRRPT